MPASLGVCGVLELADVLDRDVGHEFFLCGELGRAYRARGVAHGPAVACGSGEESRAGMEDAEACVSVDLRHVSGVMELLVKAAGRPVVVRDFENGGVMEVAPDIVAAADGLLPVFLAAGEAIWREATGGGFGLSMEADEGALTGYRAMGIGTEGFTSVMLSMMEAAAQAERPEGIVVEELAAVWEGAMTRIADPGAGNVGGRGSR